MAGVGSLNSIMTTSTDDFFGLSQGVSAICVLIYALMAVLMFIGVLMVVLMFVGVLIYVLMLVLMLMCVHL